MNEAGTLDGRAEPKISVWKKNEIVNVLRERKGRDKDQKPSWYLFVPSALTIL